MEARIPQDSNNSNTDKGELPRWRSKDRYQATLAFRTSLLEETRFFLLEYAHTRESKAACDALVNKGVLPQRSHATRKTTVSVIKRRLVHWHPPDWVLADLVAFAQQSRTDALQAALLLHTARQDTLLYDFMQLVVLPTWQNGRRVLTPADVQGFLDEAQEDHPEILRWSHATRKALASNVLTTLRDYGVLIGTTQKRLTVPIIPTPVVAHLVHMLQAEGIQDELLALHADWGLWLWDEGWTRRVVGEVLRVV